MREMDEMASLHPGETSFFLFARRALVVAEKSRAMEKRAGNGN